MEDRWTTEILPRSSLLDQTVPWPLLRLAVTSCRTTIREFRLPSLLRCGLYLVLLEAEQFWTTCISLAFWQARDVSPAVITRTPWQSTWPTVDVAWWWLDVRWRCCQSMLMRAGKPSLGIVDPGALTMVPLSKSQCSFFAQVMLPPYQKKQVCVSDKDNSDC